MQREHPVVIHSIDVITNYFLPFFPAFSKLRRLKKLNLDSNNITEIKAFAFKGLRDMEEISVQNNPIKVLSSFAFAGIRNVSSLMLGHNQLSVIEGSAFAATEMIQMLILNNNPIKVSTFIFFEHVTCLTHLRLFEYLLPSSFEIKSLDFIFLRCPKIFLLFHIC